MNQPARIPALDGIRGCAILMVTCYRFFQLSFPASHYGNFVGQLIKLGSLGVDLFFVLSGFLITSVLLDGKSQPMFFRRFFFRRTMRIFPLYFASLAIFLFLTPYFLGDGHMFAQGLVRQEYLWSYTTNLRMAWEGSWCFGYLDHFWTLAIEEQYYMAWPFVVYGFNARRLFWISMTLSIVCLIGRATFCYVSNNEVAGDVLTFFRFDGLLLGASVATVIRISSDLGRLTRVAGGMLVGSILVNSILFSQGGRLLEIPHTFVCVMWSALVLLVVSDSSKYRISALFESPLLKNLGKYSYAMYVFQNPLIPIMESVLDPDEMSKTFFGGLIYSCLMIILTYGCAVVSWHCLENWMLRLRDLAFRREKPTDQPM
ncbi:MAG: acyltransferase [Planctomycetales bacterium]|nr:acyltransferase [Planctomycetales bacterium]